MKTVVVNFTSSGTMKNGFLRLPNGTCIKMTNWEVYELYTRLALAGHKVVSVLHNDHTFTDSITF